MAPQPGRGLTAAASWRGRLADPAVLTAALALAALCSALSSPTLTWAVTGGLAGFSLSGSV